MYVCASSPKKARDSFFRDSRKMALFFSNFFCIFGYMIIVPETPITDVSFTKWNPCIKIEVKDESLEDTFHYYIIPLIDVSQQELENNLESIPSLWSSESTEFESEEGITLYTMRLFDEDMPELTTEEEVEILYKILTKKDLY